MDTNEKHYSRHGMGEGDPGSVNPQDNDYVAPSKNVSEIEKLEINESGHGVRESHRESEEYISEPVSQIDPGTKKLREEENAAKEVSTKLTDETDSSRIDNRDQNSSSDDWNAENNRTGRNR